MSELQYIRPEDGAAPVGAYSPGVVAPGPFLFTSGQVALREGHIVEGGIVEQTRQVLANLAAVLGAAGCGWGDAVKITAYVTDPELFPGFNQTYAECVESGKEPARTTLVGQPPLTGALVEMDMIAQIPQTAEQPTGGQV